MARRSAKPKKGAKSPRRVPTEITVERERLAWQLRQQFWTQAEIADELKIGQPSVCEILKRIERRTLAELSDEIAQAKARQTAQLERIAADAYQAWLASRRDTVATKTTSDGNEVTTKTTAGTPAFLAEARSALADIRKIWGIDAKPDDRPAVASPIDPRVAEAAIAAALAAEREIQGESQ